MQPNSTRSRYTNNNLGARVVGSVNGRSGGDVVVLHDLQYVMKKKRVGIDLWI